MHTHTHTSPVHICHQHGHNPWRYAGWTRSSAESHSYLYLLFRDDCTFMTCLFVCCLFGVVCSVWHSPHAHASPPHPPLPSLSHTHTHTHSHTHTHTHTHRHSSIPVWLVSFGPPLVVTPGPSRGPRTSTVTGPSQLQETICSPLSQDHSTLTNMSSLISQARDWCISVVSLCTYIDYTHRH